MKNKFSTARINSAYKSFRPNKLLGQNFLIDHNILKKIISAADIRSTDTILEVGPGKGILTFALASRARQVIAVEKDPLLVAHLKNEVGKNKISNIEIITGDILKMPKDSFARMSPYRVIANIPYYLTSRFVRILLENENSPEKILVTIQKEVAERIVAIPPKMNLLGLSVQMHATPKIQFPIPKSAFSPQPSVESALISVENISKDRFEKNNIDEKFFFDVARAAFQGKRKVLPNTLSKFTGRPKSEIVQVLKNIDVSEKARPESLSVDEWIKLVQSLAIKE